MPWGFSGLIINTSSSTEGAWPNDQWIDIFVICETLEDPSVWSWAEPIIVICTEDSVVFFPGRALPSSMFASIMHPHLSPRLSNKYDTKPPLIHNSTNYHCVPRHHHHAIATVAITAQRQRLHQRMLHIPTQFQLDPKPCLFSWECHPPVCSNDGAAATPRRSSSCGFDVGHW